MFSKFMRLGVLILAGVLVFRAVDRKSDLLSYVRSTFHSLSREVTSNIPIDFQLDRARDLLADTEPQMQRNVRLMAEEEVDIAALKADIATAEKSLDDEKIRLQKLRDDLGTPQATFTFGDFSYTREQLTDELTRQLDNFKQAQSSLLQKRTLLDNRQKALGEAMTAMDAAKVKRAALESEVVDLQARYRLVLATSTGSGLHLDNSKLTEAEVVVGEVRRELTVSEKMLAQDAKFTQPIKIDTVDEKVLLQQVDAQLGGASVAGK